MNNLEHYIWAEKFRPKTIEDMILPTHIYQKFKEFIDAKNIPHLLLSGTPGSGKTTIAKIITATVPCTFKELNASSKDRGIETVRTKITTFAKSMAKEGYIKIIFLDEADALTAEAQTALRNTMEKHSASCRFILTANYPDKIIPAIKSRCTHFKFAQFPKEQVLSFIARILQKEKIRAPKSAIQKLINLYYPDIRSIINELQKSCISGKFDITYEKNQIDITDLFDAVLSGKLSYIRQLLVNNTEYVWLYRIFYSQFIPSYGTDKEKADLAIITAQYLNSDLTTPDKEINFSAFCAKVMEVLEVKIKF